jgi:hypothetical protein
VEHAFAALKGWFQLLHELRLQMNSLKDIQISVYWVQACIILHNMIICFEEIHDSSMTTWAIQEGGGDIGNGRDDVVVQVTQGMPGQCFRVELAEQLFTELGINEQIAC